MFGNLKISPTIPGGKGTSRWSSEIALPPIRSRPNCMVAILISRLPRAFPISRANYPDPTASEGDWSAVDLEAVKAVQKQVPLGIIKSDKVLKDILLVRNSRLSVIPLAKTHFERILGFGATVC